MRVLIADDRPAIRSAICFLLQQEGQVEVVGEAANLGELIRLARTSQPDLILLDWELSGFPGSAKARPTSSDRPTQTEKRRNVILASLCQIDSHPLVVVMSGNPEAEKISLAAGASAFIFKGGPPEQLLLTIRELTSTE